MLKHILALCSVGLGRLGPPLAPPPAPSCAAPPSQLPAPPIFHVLPGTEPRGPALCESNSTNAVVLKAQCAATPGCVAFTVGSGGGEAGDLPPHDCRGSRLYDRAAIPDGIAAMTKTGVDLFLLGPAAPRNISTITPKPRLSSFPPAASTFEINRSSFRIAVADGSATNGVLTDALRRYAARDAFVGAEPRDDRASSMAAAACDALLVHIENASDTLVAGVDESYNLTISAGASRLYAKTVWGSLRGLETFAQLVLRGMPPAGADPDSAGGGSYFVDEQVIVDAPRYSYRGLMVDTARHFLPLRVLFAIVDGMAVEKLNVLHWHAVDDQSFPLEVRSLPRLAPAAQFGPAHRYSVENITALVAYGRSRGVRVMLEVDTPGHCQALQRAYPELGLITECAGTTCWPPLDVSKNSSLEFVRRVWRDLAPLFPDGDVFIGGDECHTQCWAANEGVAAWAAANNLRVDGSGEGSVFAWYVDQIVATVHGELGKRPNMWSPLFWDPASPPKQLVDSAAVLNLWTGDIPALAFNMTKSGASVVTSFGWYLDGSPAQASTYGVDPASYCEVDPAQPNFCSPDQRARIIGGEACMWGESVDLSNIFTTVWPSLTLVAEKLWSGPSPQGGLDLLDGRKRRLRRQRCRLVSRGLPVPIVASGIYAPDPSHASFATWRDYQWCPGDEHWGAAGGLAPGVDAAAAARSAHWANAAVEAAGVARARPLVTPFDS